MSSVKDSDKDLPDNLIALSTITPEHKGVALIIGNSYTRRGITDQRELWSLPTAPMEDTRSLKEAFDYLQFLTIVKHDVTQAELVSLLYSLANYPYPKSCQRFVLTFSGHGGKGFIYSEEEKRVKISDIVAAFVPPNCNKHLSGIPRLFFIDACRGDLEDRGILPRGGDEKWQSKIPSTGDILVAYATTEGYKAYEESSEGGFWTSVLAKKLVSSYNSIYDVLTEVNRALIDKIKGMGGPALQQPELLGRLNTTVHLLKESGQPAKLIQEGDHSQSTVDPVISPRPSLGREFSGKNPKSKLNELCQSMKLSSPIYQISENGLVITVSIMIEGQKVHYSYTSEQAMLMKKHIKQCEENVAEIAFTVLTELYGINRAQPQRTQSCDEQSVRPQLQKMSSCPATGSPGKKAKSQLNELFQKHTISDAEYDSSDIINGNVHNFRATLTYTVHGRNYRYESHSVFGRKQDAEEDAAQQALCEIEQQLTPPTISRGGALVNSYKSLLKERYCDKQRLSAPQYTTEITSGGFVSTVTVPQYKPVRGPEGVSKKEAEQLAAMEALKELKINNF